MNNPNAADKLPKRETPTVWVFIASNGMPVGVQRCEHEPTILPAVGWWHLYASAASLREVQWDFEVMRKRLFDMQNAAVGLSGQLSEARKALEWVKREAACNNPYPPRVWDTVLDGWCHSPTERAAKAGIAYISLIEAEAMARDARAEALSAGIANTNEVQSLLAPFMNNSSESFAPLREAWNRNAKFLSDNFREQTAWLDSIAARKDAKRGGEKDL